MPHDLQQYKAMVFDFDGVILDSERYKIAAFKSLFTDYPDQLAEIDAYNRKNRGISRYEKFAHIFNHILHLPYGEETEKRLGERYGELLSHNLAQTPLIEGVKEFLSRQKVPLFVASSSKVEEMRKVVDAKGIAQLFTELYGHPVSKADAIQKIASAQQLDPREILFFGDAIVDWETAQKTGVDFIARTDTPELFPAGTTIISTFSELLA